MNIVDIIVLMANIVITVISARAAYKANRYYEKSKHITIYAQTNKVLGELGEMLVILPEALSVNSSQKRGYNYENAISEIGRKLNEHYNTIMNTIPAEYSKDFRIKQIKGVFTLETYITSLIDGSVIVSLEDGRKSLDRRSFDKCQEVLRELQEFVKVKIEKEAESIN